MGRYTGPVCRLCRQAGEKLFLKGDRCYTPRCAIERHRRPPGDKRQTRRRLSDYSTRLREKQKLRNSYGLLEHQFVKYVKTAQRQAGITGEYLIQIMERRLDNVAYRLNFGHSRNQARQIVLHGHITVNGKKVDIPSFIVKPGDVLAWKESSRAKDFFKIITESGPQDPIPPWLSLEAATMTGRVMSLPQVVDTNMGVDTRLIVEYYSR